MKEADLRVALDGNAFVDRVVVLQNVDSTNDEVRRRAARGAVAGLVVVAGAQTAGRGRRGRRWHSPPELGLYVSVLLRPAVPVDQVTRWTLGASVAACLACRTVAGCEVGIEWPNDLVVGRRKVGGILTELRSTAGAARELVIGVGFNVHHRAEDWPPHLAPIAVSLRQAAGCGIVVTRRALAVAYLAELASVVAALEAGRWHEVASRWTECAPRARGVRVRLGGVRAGVTAGLDPSGALQVRTPDGALLRVHTADAVSVEED